MNSIQCDGPVAHMNTGDSKLQDTSCEPDTKHSTLPSAYSSLCTTGVPKMKDRTTLQLLSEILGQNVRLDAVADLKGSVPTIPINDLRGEESMSYSREECALRRSLAALYRLIDLRGWTQSIYNHISVRVPDNANHFLINPFGLLYHEVQASNLIKVDADGNVVQQGSTVLGVNKAGWTLHSALHSARPDVNCIVHVHLPDIIAVSCIRAGLLAVSPEANELLSHGVRYHDYQGILVDETEKSAIQTELGPTAKILFLRNHGVAVTASSIPEAWYLLKRVVTACQTQMRMLQLTGGSNLLADLKTAEQTPADAHPVTNGKAHSDSGDLAWTPAELEFEAEMRMLDSAGFRTGHAYRQPNLLRRTHHIHGGSTWAGDTLGDQMTGAELLTTDFSATEFSTADDVAAAEAAGAKQVAKIADSVKANRLKSAQRKQWLSEKHDPTAPGLVTSSMIGSPGSVRSAQYSPVMTRGAPFDSPVAVTPVRRPSDGDRMALLNGSPKVSRSARDQFISSKSATLPASVQQSSASNAQPTSNTLQYTNGTDEKPKSDKKVKKIGSFRMPSFSRKKKQ